MIDGEILAACYTMKWWLGMLQEKAIKDEVQYRKQVLKQEIEPVFEA
jgi:hypothetical protein